MHIDKYDLELEELWSQLSYIDRWLFRFRVTWCAYKHRHPGFSLPLVSRSMLLYMQWVCIALLVLPYLDRSWGVALAGASFLVWWRTLTTE
jgi:hypothetical protein